MRTAKVVGLVLLLALSSHLSLPGGRAAAQESEQRDAVGKTPPRLSFVDGQVSFLRPGAQEWSQAQINVPLAQGDELYTGSPGNLEIQIGPRAFVRAWANTQLGLTNQEPDFLQFKVTTGYAAFDIRTIEPGRTIEVDTPHAAFTIEAPGYYRVTVRRRPDLVHHPPRRPRHRHTGQRGVRGHLSERRGRRPGRLAAARRLVRRAGARRLGQVELRADRRAGRSGERAVRLLRRLRHAGPGPVRLVARRPQLRVGVGSRPASRRRGRRTPRAPGCSIRTTAGRGWTPRRGAGRRITTAAGCT